MSEDSELIMVTVDAFAAAASFSPPGVKEEENNGSVCQSCYRHVTHGSTDASERHTPSTERAVAAQDVLSQRRSSTRAVQKKHLNTTRGSF